MPSVQSVLYSWHCLAVTDCPIVFCPVLTPLKWALLRAVSLVSGECGAPEVVWPHSVGVTPSPAPAGSQRRARPQRACPSGDQNPHQRCPEPAGHMGVER